MTKEEILQRLETLKSQLSYAVLKSDDSKNDAQAYFELGQKQGALNAEINALQARLSDDFNYLDPDVQIRESKKNEIANLINEYDIRLKENENKKKNITASIEAIEKESERSRALVARANDDLERYENAKKVCAALVGKNFYNHDEMINATREKLVQYQGEVQSYDDRINLLKDELSQEENRTSTLIDSKNAIQAQYDSMETERKIRAGAKEADTRKLTSLLAVQHAMDVRKMVIGYDTISEINKTIDLVNNNEISKDQLVDRLAGIKEDIPTELLDIDQAERNQEIDSNGIVIADMSNEVARLQDKTSDRNNYLYSALELDRDSYEITKTQQQYDKANREIGDTEKDIAELNADFSAIEKNVESCNRTIDDYTNLNLQVGTLIRGIEDDPKAFDAYKGVLEGNRTLIDTKKKELNGYMAQLEAINLERSTKEEKLTLLKSNADNLSKSVAVQTEMYNKKMNSIDEIKYKNDLDGLNSLSERKNILEAKNSFLGFNLGENFDELIALVPNLEETKVEEPIIESPVMDEIIPEEPLSAIEDIPLEPTYSKEEEPKKEEKQECTALALRLDDKARVPLMGFEEASAPLKESAKKASFIKKLKDWVKKYKVQIAAAALALALTLGLHSCVNQNDYKDKINGDDGIRQEQMMDETEDEEPVIDVEDEEKDDDVAPSVTIPSNTEKAPVIEEKPVQEAPVIEEKPIEEAPVIEEKPIEELPIEELPIETPVIPPEEVVVPPADEIVVPPVDPVIPPVDPIVPPIEEYVPITPVDPVIPEKPVEKDTVDVHLNEGDVFVTDDFVINNGGTDNGNLVNQETEAAKENGVDLKDYTETTSDNLQTVTNNNDGSMDVEIEAGNGTLKDDATINQTPSNGATSGYIDDMNQILSDNLNDMYGDVDVIDSQGNVYSGEGLSR